MRDDVLASVGQRKLTRSNVISVLREAIINGTLKPGEQIVETQLAAQMGISRGPLREALRNLEEEGLVESIPYQGTFVTELLEVDFHDLLETRKVLEGACVQTAATKASPQDVKRLHRIVDMMREAAHAKDVNAFVRHDLEFHRAICQIAGNKLMLQLWDHIGPRIHRWLVFKERLWSVNMVEVAEKHQAIAEAIARKDPPAALIIAQAHLMVSMTELMFADGRVIEQNGGPGLT